MNDILKQDFFYTLMALMFPFFGLSQDASQSKDTDTTKLEYTFQEDVVISANRKKVSTESASYSISAIGGQKMIESGVRSLPEGLIGVPGVWMQKTNHGGGSAFIRGLTGNQTLLLMDGIRLNNSTYRYGPNQYLNTIDALNIHQVEVLRGAGSVLYGSDAIGGAMQILTPEPQLSVTGKQWRGSVYSKYLSDDMEKTLSAKLAYSGKKVAFLAQGNVRDFGDLVAGGDLGAEAPSSYLEKAASLKGKFLLGKRSDLLVAYNGVFQHNVGRFDQVAQRGYELYQFHPQIRQMAYARLRFYSDNKWFEKITLTPSYQHAHETREKKKKADPVTKTEEDIVHTTGFVAEIHSTVSKKWGMISGLEYYGDDVNSHTFRQEGAISYSVERGLYPDDSKAYSFSAFTLSEVDLNPFFIQAGIRYHKAILNIEDDLFGDTHLKPQALVGSLSLRYKLRGGHVFGASANSGFRSPNINDMSSFGGFDYGIEVPAESLEPEKSLNMELTYRYSKPSFNFNAALFKTRLFDLITREKATYLGQPSYEGEDIYKKSNVASAFVQGFEMGGNWFLSQKVSLSGNINYTFGENESKEEPMRRIPPLYGFIGAQFQPGDAFNFGLHYLFAGEQDRLSSGDISDHRIEEGGTPAWQLVNLNATYAFKKLSLNAGINNLFNEAYRMHGSGVDGMGRSFWVSVLFGSSR